MALLEEARNILRKTSNYPKKDS